MKRSIAIAAIALTAAAAAYSQAIPTLDGFKDAFTGIAGEIAGSLALDSTFGSNWSDAYIGKFPHFGIGATAGAAFVSVAGATALFDAMGASALPDALKTLGLPIPAAVGTIKIGLPFLPMDIGVKGSYIPPSVGDQLKAATGVSAEYSNVGVQLRYALVKQNIFLPNISIGASYNYQEGKIVAPSGIGAKSFTTTTDQGATTITASDPGIALGWKSNTFDFTAQISKKLLFIVPYAGVGYTIGTSSLTGGISSSMSTNYAGGIAALNNYLTSNGGPTIDDQGFTYTAQANDPILRVYGGVSLRIIIIDLDAQAIYVPDTQALGASITARLQF